MTDEERKAKEKAAISTAVNHLVPIQKVAIEELTATENDTYTAPSGKAYTPVTVNVSGGGSSDFTTATVSLMNTSNDYGADYSTMACAYDEDNEYADYGAGSYSELSVGWGYEEAIENTAILYKGKCILMFGAAVLKTNIATTGSVTLIDAIQQTKALGAVITGDCTITVTA